MADELKITISAQDNASQVFKKIATEAGKVADELEKAGKDGGKGFDELGKSAEKADASLLQLSSSGSGVIRSLNDGASAADEFGNRLLQLGSGLQSVGTALDGLGQSSIDQQRQILALNQLYGESSQQYQDFAKTVQNTTIFSDDQVRQAEIYFATLKNNYDVTDEQIQRLVQVSADLATIHGYSLEDAALRVQAAIRGEGESIEALGLTMNQQSIDQNNLTLSMSNQEAAQFRLNALWEQTANVTGASTQYVQTANGQWQQFKNTMQDVGQNVGGVVGPFGDIFSTLGRGLATVGDATRGFGEIKSGLTGLIGVLGNSSTAMAALALATNPVTLAIGAVGAAAIAGIAIWDLYNSSLDGVTAKFGDLEQAQQNALLNGDAARARAIENTTADLHKVEQAINDALTIGPNGPNIPVPSDGMYEKVLGSITKALSDSRVDVELYSAFLAEEFQKIYDDPSKAGEVFNEIINVSTNELGRFSSEAAKSAAAIKQATQFIGEFEASLVRSNAQLAENGRLASSTGDAIAELYRAQTGKYPAEDAQRRHNALLREQARLEHELGEAIESGNRKDIDSYTGQLEAVNDELEKQNAELARNLALRAQLANAGLIDSGFAGVDEANAKNVEARAARWASIGTAAGKQVATSMEDAAVAAMQTTVALEGGAQALDATASAAERAAAKVQAINETQKQVIANYLEMTGNDDFVSQLNLAGAGTEYTKLAENINDANTALQDGYRIIVGNTNAIAQNAQSVNDWADTLIGAVGTYAQIDDLLADGVITLDTYNAAQEAQGRIFAANAEIQQDVLAIQAQQAPLLADLTEQQAAYIDELSKQPAQQQLITLGWMDATEAAKANQAVTMAAAAANGELGASGQEAVEKMILAQAKADPVYKQMLLDIGLLEEKTDRMGNKTLSVNFDNAKGANDSIVELTKSIDALTLALGGVPPLHIDPGNLPEVTALLDAATGAADKAAAAIKTYTGADVPGTGGYIDSGPVIPATAQVTAVDTSSAPVAETPATAVIQGPPDLSGVPPVQVPATLAFDLGAGAADAVTNAAGNALGGAQDIKVAVTATADVSEAVIGLSNLQTQADTLNNTPAVVSVTADVADAVVGLYNLQTQAETLNATPVTIALEATDNASATIGAVGAFAGGLDGYVSTVTMSAVDAASATIGAVGAFAGGLDGYVSNITMEAIDNASDIIGAVGALAGGLDGYVSTITMNAVTVYSTVGTPPSTVSKAQHGGLLHYASGGLIPHIAGEGNRPEIAHYANGGMAVLPFEGLYANPPGTYISPAPANPGAGGGTTIIVNVNGDSYGIDHLTTKVGSAVFQALGEEARRERLARGVS